MAASLKFPTTFVGRLIALLFLGTLAACLFIPATPAPIRFGLDLAVAWSVLAVFFLLTLSPAAFSKADPGLRLDFLDLLVFLSIGWVLLSAWNSSEIFESFASFKNFLALGLWWLCLRRAWKRVPELYPLFEKGIRFAALLLSAWILGGLALNHFEPFAGPFPNVNFTAIFLGVALILWATEWLHGNSTRSALALLFIFAAWGGTQSRGAFLALAVTLVFYLLLHYGAVEARLRRFKTRQWLFFAAAALFMLACSALMIERLLGGDRIDPRSSSRIQVWVSAFHMACDQPLFGYGPGTFETLYPYYRSPEIWNTTTPFAHNELLQAAAQSGWPALGLLVLFATVLFWNTWRLARENPPFKALAPPQRAAEISLLLLVYAGLDNLVDYTFHAWSIALTLTAFFTFALRNERVSGIEINLQFSPAALRILRGLSLLLIFWVMGVGAGRDAFARLSYVRGQWLQQEGRSEEAGRALNQSLAFRPQLTETWSLLGDIALKAAVHEKDAAVRTAYFHLAQEDFDQAVSVAPKAVTPRENQIQLMEYRGRWDEALDLQSALTARLPNLPVNYLEEGKILMAEGKLSEVLPVAQKAIDLDNYLLEAYFQKAKALELLGRRNQAVQVYREVEVKLRSIDLTDKIPLVENEIHRLESRS